MTDDFHAIRAKGNNNNNNNNKTIALSGCNLIVNTITLQKAIMEPTIAKTTTTATNDTEEDDKEELFFVGCYTQAEPFVPNGCGDGIYSFFLNSNTGIIRQGPTLSGTTSLPLTNPTYLHYNSAQQRLYAIEEVWGVAPARPGHVISYQVVDAHNKAILTEVSRQDSKTQAGCHLTEYPSSSSNQDSEDYYLFVAGYASGNLVVATVNKDGTLQSQLGVHQYQGKLGPNPDRQDAPHAHQVVVSPDEKFIYVCDLGTDTVWCHDAKPLLEQLRSQQEETTTITLPAPTKAATCPPGSGPRHLVFHPTIPNQVYVLSELSGMILAYRQDPTTGGFELIHQVSSLPSEKSGTSSNSGEVGSAAIRIHPSGKALYVSNRGRYNHIVVIPLISTTDDDGDRVAGSLDMEHASWIATGGKTPRDFALDKSGKWMIVGNQDDHTLAVFALLAPDKVDANPTQMIPCKTPACVTFSC